MGSELPHRDPGRPDDDTAGTRPAMLFAAGLGGLVGGTSLAIFVGGSALISAFGGLGTGTSGLLAAALVWVAFWLGLSLGLAAGLLLGFRIWARLAPPRARSRAQRAKRAEERAAQAAARQEELAAVRAAEALLQQRSKRPHEE
jgi:Flp pilus assembly protein protease CpaA